MPVELKTNTTALTTDEIRMFLRDQPEYNILLDDVEFEDKDILLAMKLTVSKWNAITPMTNMTDPNSLNSYILLFGVCGFLLKSEGLRQVRNQLQTQDGNISPVGMDEKESLYMRWASHFQNEFATRAQALKIQANVEVLLDAGSDMKTAGFGSEYRYSGRYY